MHALPLQRPSVRFVAPDAASSVPEGAAAYVPYFDVRCEFGNARTRSLLAPQDVEEPSPPACLRPVIGYAHASNWGKRPMTREHAQRLISPPAV